MDTPPLHLIERLRLCQKELELRVQKMIETTGFCAQVALMTRWDATFLSMITLLEMEAVNPRAVMFMEMSLVECSKQCQTSLDLRGMSYINVYMITRPRATGGEETRELIQSFICYTDQHQVVMDMATKRFTSLQCNLSMAEKREDFQPRFEILHELTSSLLFNGVNGVENVSYN